MNESPPKRVYARPPQELIDKDPADWTDDDKAKFDQFVSEFYDYLTASRPRPRRRPGKGDDSASDEAHRALD